MNPIARMMKRYIKTPLKYALPLLCIGALVLVSISGCTSPATTSPSPSASSVPTATPIATATPKATPITPMSASDLAALEASLQGQGYTITQHLVRNGTTVPEGYPNSYALYRGMMTKDGIANSVTIVHTNSAMDAQAELPSVVSIVGSHGFSGSYSPGSPTGWSGSVISSTTGNSMRAEVFSSGTNVIAVVAAG